MKSLEDGLFYNKLTSWSGGRAYVSKKIGVGIPKNPLEAQNDLIKVAKAEPLDGWEFPVRQRRNKFHHIGSFATLNLIRCDLLENS